MMTSPAPSATTFGHSVTLLQSALVFALGALCWGTASATEDTDRQRGRALPPLATVLDQAKANAPQVRLGAAALAVSRTESVNAERLPLGNPYIEATGQRGSDGATRGIAWAGNLWLPLEPFGQRGRRMSEARAYRDIFEANLDLALAASLGEAFAAYGATHVAAERVLVIEQMVGLAKHTSEIYQARLASGDAVLRDATMAKVELARNEVLLQDARGRLTGALTHLSRLTGQSYSQVSSPTLALPVVGFDDYLERVRRRLPPAVSSSDAEAEYFDRQRQRLDTEALGQPTLMLMGGRGDLGEARVGLGLAYEFPVVRSLQGERARAESEALKARTQSAVSRGLIERQLDGIAQRYRYGQGAFQMLTDVALPAAHAAVDSATATLEAGKTDWFAVLLSRRDLAMLSLERLDVVAQQWSLIGELIQLTGEMP